MKYQIIKRFPLLLILVSLCAMAQINSGVGYMHGTDKKGDTIIDYQDKPKYHVHEQVQIINEKKLSPNDPKVKAMRKEEKPADTTATAFAPQADTTVAAATPPPTDTAATASTSSATYTSDDTCCFSKGTVYAIGGLIGLLLAIIIGLIVSRSRDSRNNRT